jgi:hypothetical protein
VTDRPTQRPVRVSDADRIATVSHLEAALAEGRISVDEMERRAEAARAAATTTELEPLLADLPDPSPQQAQMVGSRAPETLFDFVADVRAGDGTPVPRRAGAVFGDVRIDLRQLDTDAEMIELNLWSVLGDVEVIVAEGVDADLNGWTVIGRRKVDLAPMPRRAGTPRVAVRAHSILGDLRLRSLGPGEPAGRRTILGWLARRTPPPAPPMA